MVIEMTPQELRDYIRFMPDDEVLKITIEFRRFPLIYDLKLASSDR